MRITPELIENCYQYTNKPTGDRELRLRSLKIDKIENLGATLNQFDCLDFSENNIKKVENFPLLPRLKCLLLNNNRIYKIAQNLDESIPNLERLILTNNYISELGDIDVLSRLRNLNSLSLLNNPVTQKQHYRYYIINKLPQLKLLDFNKVKLTERTEAKALFSGSSGSMLAESIGIRTVESVENKSVNRSKQRRKRVDDEITTKMDEANMQSIQRINKLLKSGYVPGQKTNDLMDDIDIGGEEDSTPRTGQ